MRTGKWPRRVNCITFASLRCYLKSFRLRVLTKRWFVAIITNKETGYVDQL
jgi:hypothetical protein